MNSFRTLILFVFIGVNTQAQDLRILLDSSDYYWDNQKYTEAYNTLSKAVDAAKIQFDSKTDNSAFNYAYILNQMGVRLYMGENYETALSYYNAAIPIYEKLQGENGMDYLTCVENMALCYNSFGKTQDALQLYTYLLTNETYLQAAGENVFQVYNIAGICAYQLDNYEKAKEYYLKSLTFLDETMPDFWVLVENVIILEQTWAEYAEAYKWLKPFLAKFPDKEKEYSNVIAYHNRDLGHVEFNKGNYAGAIPFLKNTIKYLLPTDSIAVVSAIYALQDLSSAYANSRNFSEGLPYLIENERKVAMHYGIGSEDHFVAINDLALAYAEIADYKNAHKYYNKGFKLIDKLEDSKKGEMLSLLDVNYSDYLLKLGKYTEAKIYVDRAIDYYKSNGVKYFDDLIFGLNQRGILLLTNGEYEKAETLFQQILKMQNEKYGWENDMSTQIASNLTSLYMMTGRGVRASQFMQFILGNDLNLHGRESFEYSFSLQVAGTLYTTTGDHLKAIEVLTQSYDIRERMVGGKNRELLRLKQSIGTAYFKAGKSDKAEEILSEVLETQKESIGKNNFDITITQNDLGLVMLSKKDYQHAEKLFEQSYELKERLLGSHNQFTITSLFNMACTSLLTEKKEQSLEYFKKSIDDYLYVLDEYFPHLSEKERLEYYHTIKGQLGAYFSFLNQELDEHPEYASLLYDTHIKTKAMLLSESKKLRAFLENHKDPNVQNAYNKWTSINEEIAKLEQYKNERAKQIYLDSIKIVGEEYERILNTLSKTKTKPKNVSWKDIAQSLKVGEVAIEVVRIKKFDFEKNTLEKEKVSYVAMIVDNKTVDFPKYVTLEDGFFMDSKYFNVYKNNMKFKLEDDRSYNNFWKPIAEKVAGYDKIYFSSDGVYHLLNINTLLNPTTSKYVINESVIEILGNTNELLSKDTVSPKTKDAILFGFPNFNTQPDIQSHDSLRSSVYRDIFTSGVSDLPGTKIEISNINSMMNVAGIQTTSFLSNDAHEKQLKGIGSADILHIATHGFFEESSEDVINDDPLTHSGLLLANIKESAGMQEENGIITAKELAQLNLTDNKLVVLSACETGKGKVVDGEGVYGLQRAFQVAGAANVIISLWKVDDAATQQLMTYFYENYLVSNNPRTALHVAQVKLQGEYPHPNYWGAFYVVGK